MHGTLGTMLEEELMISTRVASYLSSLFIFSPNDSSPYFFKPKKKCFLRNWLFLASRILGREILYYIPFCNTLK